MFYIILCSSAEILQHNSFLLTFTILQVTVRESGNVRYTYRIFIFLFDIYFTVKNVAFFLHIYQHQKITTCIEVICNEYTCEIQNNTLKFQIPRAPTAPFFQ